MDALLRHYERRNIVAKAVMWGLLVALVGLSLDYEVSQLRWPWPHERMLKNMIEGVFVALLVWVVLSAREKRLHQRFKELGYFNYHIRNSLAVIEMAEGTLARRTNAGDGQQRQHANSTLHRTNFPGGRLRDQRAISS